MAIVAQLFSLALIDVALQIETFLGKCSIFFDKGRELFRSRQSTRGPTFLGLRETKFDWNSWGGGR